LFGFVKLGRSALLQGKFCVGSEATKLPVADRSCLQPAHSAFILGFVKRLSSLMKER